MSEICNYLELDALLKKISIDLSFILTVLRNKITLREGGGRGVTFLMAAARLFAPSTAKE